MDDKVLFKRKTSNELSGLPIENGSLIYNVETGDTYMDYNNERIQTSKMTVTPMDYATLADVYGYGTRVESITIPTNGWVLNNQTNEYEYTVLDENVTSRHLVRGDMDLTNQAKMEDGYTKSFDGSYKIITSSLPTESITMTISMVLAVPDTPITSE